MFVTTLAGTSDPKELIPGNPQVVHTIASRFTDYGDALVMTGEDLKKISTEHSWKGEAADAFRNAFDGEPKRWITCGDVFHDAAGALTNYAHTLEWAQGEAKEAVALWQEAQAATEKAKAQHQITATAAMMSGMHLPASIPFHDPGESKREAARNKLERARGQLKEASDRAECIIAQGRDASRSSGMS